ncbi:hypothetical protein [Candidatus Tisiphia endosymbiont of Hybos culiciformis]|uniref:hypothetical protein n=1 Tax=Candidatus Tisiphia endosymbiont of Hybos culiciformis TaxID=3139331 RepID=UPI003CCAF92E
MVGSNEKEKNLPEDITTINNIEFNEYAAAHRPLSDTLDSISTNLSSVPSEVLAHIIIANFNSMWYNFTSKLNSKTESIENTVLDTKLTCDISCDDFNIDDVPCAGDLVLDLAY